jgi:hypothetical protein
MSVRSSAPGVLRPMWPAVRCFRKTRGMRRLENVVRGNRARIESVICSVLSLIAAIIVHLSITDGNCPESACGYVRHTMVVSSRERSGP